MRRQLYALLLIATVALLSLNPLMAFDLGFGAMLCIIPLFTAVVIALRHPNI